MKTLRLLSAVCLLLTTIIGFTQTPEHQKMMDDAKRMQDSIMNTPMFKQLMEQTKAMEVQQKEEREKRKVAEKKPTQNTQKAAGHLDGYIISNSNSKRFDNWQQGEADIILITQTYSPNNRKELKIGTIKADGSFDYTLPEEVGYDRTISDFFKCQNKTSTSETSYSAPNTGIVTSYVSVKNNDGVIGTMSIATSKQQAYNDSPIGLYRGDPGYRLHWWYVSSAASANATCTRMMEATDHAEIEMNIEINDVYDLNFNLGWNLVKTEIIGSQNVGQIPYYKTKKHTVVSSLPNDARWVFHVTAL